MPQRHHARPGAPDADTVLAAARARLHAEGIAGLTVRALAADLGVSRQVVYSRFGSKAGLLNALYADGFAQLALAIQRANTAEAPGTDAHALAIARAYRSHAHAAPAIYALMFEEQSPSFAPDDEARAVRDRAFGDLVKVATVWLQAQTAVHEPGRQAARQLARALWAASHGVVALERAGHLSERLAARQLHDLVQRILDGSR